MTPGVKHTCLVGGGGRAALEGKGPPRRPRRRLGRRLEEVAEAVGGGYCRLQMPLRVALGVRETVAGHRLDALEGGGGVTSPPSNASLWEREGGGGGIPQKKAEGLPLNRSRPGRPPPRPPPPHTHPHHQPQSTAHGSSTAASAPTGGGPVTGWTGTCHAPSEMGCGPATPTQRPPEGGTRQQGHSATGTQSRKGRSTGGASHDFEWRARRPHRPRGPRVQ